MLITKKCSMLKAYMTVLLMTYFKLSCETKPISSTHSGHNTTIPMSYTHSCTAWTTQLIQTDNL